MIGDRNTIREFCTIHIGTVQDAASPASATTTGSWPTSTSRTTAGRQPHDHRRQRAPGRPRAAGRLGDRRRHDRRPPVRAHRRARDARLPEPRLAGRAAVHDGRRPPAGRCAASTSRACAGAASPPSASARSSRCHRLLYRDGLTLEDARARIAALAAAVAEAEADVALDRSTSSRRPSAASLADRRRRRDGCRIPARRDGRGRGLRRPARRLAAARPAGSAGPGSQPRASAARAWPSRASIAWWPHDKLAVRGYVEVLRHFREILAIRKPAAATACSPSARMPSSASTRPISTSGSSAGCAPRASRPCTSSARRSGPGAASGSKSIERATDHVLCVFPFEPELLRASAASPRPTSAIRWPTPFRSRCRAPRRAPRWASARTSRSSRCCRAAAARRSSTSRRACSRRRRRCSRRGPALRFVCRSSPGMRARRRAAVARSTRRCARSTLLDGRAHEALAACDVDPGRQRHGDARGGAVQAADGHRLRAALLTWQLGKRMHYQPWVALPNILLREFAVPELLQGDATPTRSPRPGSDGSTTARAVESLRRALRGHPPRAATRHRCARHRGDRPVLAA